MQNEASRCFERQCLPSVQPQIEPEIAASKFIPAGCELVTPEMLPLIQLDQSQIDGIVRTVPGGATNVQDIYPLSPLQEGMLFHRLLNPHSDPYVLSTCFELQSESQIDLVRGAVQNVVNRHDALRTALLWETLPRPVQLVYRHAALPVHDVWLDAGRDTRSQLDDLMRPGHWTFDLQQAPLLRLESVRDTYNQKWYVILRVHHVVCDHQSLNMLVAETLTNLAGVASNLPAPVPYRHHVWQALTGARDEAAKAFFCSKLADAEPTSAFGLTDVHGDATRIEEAQLVMEAELARQIRSWAKKLGRSPARLFHAAWALVVAAISGRDDIVYGTVVLTAEQRAARGGRMLGLSVNTLPLRLHLTASTALELVEQTDRELSELLKFEKTPLTLAQACSRAGANGSLFTSLLNFRRNPSEPVNGAASSAGVRVIARGEAYTNYPITLIVDDVNGGFTLTAQTDPRIDPHRTIGYLCTAIQSLLEALSHAPQTPAMSLEIVPVTERQQILRIFNATAAPFAHEKLIHQLFEEQVERTPQAIALVYEEQSLTYEQLNARANRLAWYLIENGIGPDRLVGLCIERGLEMVIALLGILKAGGAYVPLDPHSPIERLVYTLEDAAPAILLTSARVREKLPPTAAKAVALDDEWNVIAGYPANNPDPRVRGLGATHLAYVIYTSGSTGQPKGAMNEHRAVVNRLQWMQNQYRLGDRDRVIQKTPFSFDVSVWEFFWTLSSGARLIIARPQGHQDPGYLVQLMEQAAVTTAHFVPSMLQVFVEQLDAGQCPSLRHVVCSGEELPASLQSRFFERLPHVRLSNLYGPTEAAVDVTFWECRADARCERVPIGRPISNIHMGVLDGYQKIVPLGMAGEIYIGGTGVGRGYWKRPQLTAERFVPDPFSDDPHARMYRTGDLGRWRSDGVIEYLGRNDNQVKIRGFRIELGEIEAQLTSHERVKEAAVLVRQDSRGEKRLVAYVVLNGTSQAPEASLAETLRAHLKTKLPEHMLPGAFVRLDFFPLSPNGKLDRRMLPEPQEDALVSRQYAAPEGEIEEILAGIWQELLRVERIGRHDNFLELGGHSLLIVQMLERLRKVGLSVELRRVFDSPTLADLASALTRDAIAQYQVPENRIPPGCMEITPEMLPLVDLLPEHVERIVQAVPGGALNVKDIYSLAPLQEGILFHHLLNARSADTYIPDTYIVPIALSISSRSRLEEFIAALQAVIDRHDVLRTAVMWEQLPHPVQVVLRSASLQVEQIELDPNREPTKQIADWVASGGARFDLRRAPLVRLQIAADPVVPERWYALLQLHHIALDNTSQEIVKSEVLAELEGRGTQLPDSVPYRNHVAQALAWARMNDSEAFFRGKLGDIDEPTAPFGLLDVHGDGTQVDEAREVVELELSRRLRIQARRLAVSTAALFHAAWGLVVAYASGRDDVVFGTVLLGRLQGSAGAQRILGMFINTLPLRLRLGDATASELVQQTQIELVQLLNHEQASLAAAQRCSGIGGLTPLFSALLNYRHYAPAAQAQWANAAGIEVVAIRERTNYPITMSVDDLGEGFALTAMTDRRIEPTRVIGYLQLALQSLLDELESSQQRPVSMLPLMPRTEWLKIESFNATRVARSAESLVHELVAEHVQNMPDAVAVMFEGASLTYAQLDAKANQLARFLVEKGVGANQVVGICMPRGLMMVVGVLSILKAGGAYLPLDPSYPAERLQYMLADAAPGVVLVHESTRDLLRTNAVELVVLDEGMSGQQSYAAHALQAEELGLQASNLLYVIYTSGSTGRPKGIEMSHGAMGNLIRWHRAAFPLEARQRVLQFAALSFDVAFQEIFSTLAGGGTLVLLNEQVRRDPRALLQFLTEHAIERLFIPPLMLQALAETFIVAGGELPPLRDIVTAGEQLRVSAEVVELCKRLRGCRLHNHYGPTETHVVTALTLSGDPERWPELPAIGRPVWNTQIYILNQQLQPVPMGVTGEVYIAGDNLARGYLKRSELTAQRFVRNPFDSDPRARMYKTGDLGRWCSDGTIEYLGRSDGQVKLRGYRIELEEIEAVLALHAQVKQAAVILREDVPGEKLLVAYVTPRNSVPPELEALRQHLRQRLPDYMVPSAIIVLERLPLTPNGKLDRRALPAPEFGAYMARRYEAPQGELEQMLAGIWQEVLHVERVGRNDHFFELGGHSLLAMKLVARIQATLGVEVPVALPFDCPTLQDLAAGIAELRYLRLAERADTDDEPIEDLIERVISMPESEVQQLLTQLEGRL